MSVLEMAGWALRFNGGGEMVAAFSGSGRFPLAVEDGFDGDILNTHERQRKTLNVNRRQRHGGPAEAELEAMCLAGEIQTANRQT